MAKDYKITLKEVASNLTLLYVEDDPETRKVFEKLLTPYFKTIKSFNNGKEALDEYVHTQYDLVLTDMAMPEMDGLELIEKIHLINRAQYIIVCSTYDQPLLLIGLLNEGVDGFIMKPVDVNNALKNLCRVCTHIQEGKASSKC